MSERTKETAIRTMRTLRLKANYTQSEVSRLLNIQRATYCNYENGYRTPPLEIITALAGLYHVSADYLLLGIDTVTSRDPLAKELLREFENLSEQFKRETLQFIRFKKLLLNYYSPKGS